MDTHAWAEVYFQGLGWIPIESTPGFGNSVTLPDVTHEPESEQELQDPSPEPTPAPEAEPEPVFCRHHARHGDHIRSFPELLHTQPLLLDPLRY